MTRSVLIVGGTRNLGNYTARRFLESGARVTVVNRGVTPDDLPPGIERLRADRTQAAAFRAVLGGRDFDLVVDTALYTGADAEAAVDIFAGRTGRYIFISTGQVYLVRLGAGRPCREEDYDGPVMPPPGLASPDYSQWAYGAWKRDAEDVFSRAWQKRRFPFTSLRLPMVNSPRDHYDRIRNYIARIEDGGPILIPAGPHPLLRHVWVHDVVDVMVSLAGSGVGFGVAYNLSQDETVTIDDFLGALAAALGGACRLQRVPREELERHRLLPACSPFSGRWMSELDNARSVRELQARYTPVRDVIATLVAEHRAHPDAPPPADYASRARELALTERATP